MRSTLITTAFLLSLSAQAQRPEQPKLSLQKSIGSTTLTLSAPITNQEPAKTFVVFQRTRVLNADGYDYPTTDVSRHQSLDEAKAARDRLDPPVTFESDRSLTNSHLDVRRPHYYVREETEETQEACVQNRFDALTSQLAEGGPLNWLLKNKVKKMSFAFCGTISEVSVYENSGRRYGDLIPVPFE
jgi:hypothetical protein